MKKTKKKNKKVGIMIERVMLRLFKLQKQDKDDQKTVVYLLQFLIQNIV